MKKIKKGLFILARYCNVLPFYGEPQTAFNQIYQMLTASGFQYVQYQNENVFQKGTGLLTGPTFVKVSFYGQFVQVEAWMKFALLPGVFVGELGMTGFVGFAVKGTMKNAVHQIESMLQYYAYPSQR